MFLLRLFCIGYVHFSVCILTGAQENSIDAQMGRRYEFRLFENTKECAELYRKESKVVDKLWYAKTKFLEIKNAISRLKSFKNSTAYKMEKLQLILHQGKGFQKNQMLSFAYMIQDFPQLEDFIGSIKAMFILHYSYGLNMSLAVQEGKLAYTNHFGEVVKYQVHFKSFNH